MITKNIKVVKKISYYGLTLFSTVLTLSAPAADSFSKDFVDYSVKGGTVRVPQQPESPLDFLEKWPKMPWDCNTKENKIQSPPMGSYHQLSEQVSGIDECIAQTKKTLGEVENFFIDGILIVEKKIEEYQKKKEKERNIHLVTSTISGFFLNGALEEADKKHLTEPIAELWNFRA